MNIPIWKEEYVYDIACERMASHREEDRDGVYNRM